MHSGLAMLAVLQDDHGAAEGFASPFEVNFGLFFWTWVVFIVLFFVLKRFAWPAIVGATVERERKIANQLEEADRLNNEARAALDEQKALLAGAKDQAHALIAEAKSVAEKDREQMVAKTREEQIEMLDRAKREISAERERAIADLRREAVELSLAAASRLIEQRLDSEGDRKIVTDYLASLEERK